MRFSKSQTVGREGEKLALQHLQKKGLRLKCMNYGCKLGEVDLIMQDGDTRVFVEVRLRAPTSYGQGCDTVSFHKQSKIIRTAKYYQQREDYWGNIRFDVVSIESDVNTGGCVLQHIPDAFGE